jgi:hypothetical protein
MGTIVRLVFLIALFALLFLSQRYWYRVASQLAGRIRQRVPRVVLRAAVLAAVVVSLGATLHWMVQAQRATSVRIAFAMPLLGLWLAASLAAYLGIVAVQTLERLCTVFVRPRKTSKLLPATKPAGERADATTDTLTDPSRRYFFQTASYFAGAVPFVGGLYGFLVGRLRYTVERIEIPISGLPGALDGLRIVQLSDIHIGTYMPRDQVRRAVEMANELGADLAVVTGDFITGASDPLGACVEEVARLRAPLGVWGCLGNHEIYVDCEDEATRLLGQAGVRVLRRQGAEVIFRGFPLNLIGVDHQRTRVVNDRRVPMLAGIEPLVRRDAFNILLSHNPNAFERAAELGIELTLSGHTHGGQIHVEILEHHLSPAQFLTEFVAGLYRRPRSFAATSGQRPATIDRRPLTTRHSPLATAFLYVNRGLGTIGAPLRFNAPPEITLLTLRRLA